MKYITRFLKKRRDKARRRPMWWWIHAAKLKPGCVLCRFGHDGGLMGITDCKQIAWMRVHLISLQLHLNDCHTTIQ
jgi:hypothetical protein